MGVMILAAIFSVAFYWVRPNDVELIFGLNIIIGLTAGIVLPLIWSMYADIADYSEWQTGRSATRLVFLSSSMSQKMDGLWEEQLLVGYLQVTVLKLIQYKQKSL